VSTPPPPPAQPPATTTGQAGEVGKVRRPGIVVLLFIVTLGIYGLFWYYWTFSETKRYSGHGLGGVLGLLLAIFCGIVTIFLLPDEVANLYRGRGDQDPPISALAGFWNFIPIIGGIIWLVKVQRRLNEFWEATPAH